jgi:hypothetical protein
MRTHPPAAAKRFATPQVGAIDIYTITMAGLAHGGGVDPGLKLENRTGPQQPLA